MNQHHHNCDHTCNHDHTPRDVQADIDHVAGMFETEQPTVDPHYDRILETLTQVSDQLREEEQTTDRFIFNQAEFVDALDHIVKDQLSALKKEKLPSAEFAKRFNRWFVFCDTVANLGISCLYSKDAAQKQDYETIFKTLKINKQFETTFLKPRGIKIELRHKSKDVMEKYPWLAMPVLVLKDESGEEHLIAITPSPSARVWWLDVLAGFHGSYSWIQTETSAEEDDNVSTTSLADPYPEGLDAEEEEEEEEGEEEGNDELIPDHPTVFTEVEHPKATVEEVAPTQVEVTPAQPLKSKPSLLRRVWNWFKNFCR